MSIEKVRKYFAQWGMEDRVMELDHSSATVEAAAAALHTEGRRIAKSMSFLLKEGQPIMIIFAGYTKEMEKFIKINPGLQLSL